MRSGLIFYIWIHIILVAVGSLIGFVAIMDMNSIEEIWPPCGLLIAFSLYIASVAYERNRTLCIYYAFTGATVFIIYLTALLGLDLKNFQVRILIGASLALFGLSNIPFGIVVLLKVKRSRRGVRRKGPFQYSIAAIIGLMTLVAVSISMIKTMGNRGIALSILLCYFSLMGYVLKQFHQFDRNDKNN